MQLSEYFFTFPKQERRKQRIKVARKLNISLNYLYSMCSGHKRIQEKYAVLIEKATNGAVRREEAVPHLYR